MKKLLKENLLASVIGIPAAIVSAILVAILIQDARFAPRNSDEQPITNVSKAEIDIDRSTNASKEEEVAVPSPTLEIALPTSTSLPLLTETPNATVEDTITPESTIDTSLSQPAERLEIDGVQASSQWSSGYAGQNVDDGNFGSYWSTRRGNTAGETLVLLFREAKLVTEIGFYTPENVSGSLLRLATLTFSDGSTQTISLDSVAGWEYAELMPVQTDSILIAVDGIKDVTASDYMSIYELQLFGVDLEIEPIIGIAKQIPISSAEGSSEWSSSYSGMQAIDNSLASYWATKAGDSKGTSLTLQIEQPRIVSFVGLYRPIFGEGLPLKTATLVFSNNSTQIIEFRGLFGWEYVAIDPVSTSSVGVIVENSFPNPNGDTYSSIYEVQLFGE